MSLKLKLYYFNSRIPIDLFYDTYKQIGLIDKTRMLMIEGSKNDKEGSPHHHVGVTVGE